MKMKHTALYLLPLCLTLVACSGDDSEQAAKETMKEQSATVAEKAKEMQESASNKVNEMTEAASEMKESAQEKTGEMMDKGAAMVSETKEVVAEKATELKTSATETASAMVAKAESMIGNRDEMVDLAKKHGCFACHAIDKKMVGPSWNAVAEKYSDDSAYRAQLIASIKNGAKGMWGPMPMPANSPRVSDADIEKLTDFILSLK